MNLNESKQPAVETASFQDGNLILGLAGSAMKGAVLFIPARSIHKSIASLSDEQLGRVEIVRDGSVLYWREQDTEMSVPALIEMAIGIESHRSQLQGISRRRTPAKATAARANGALGGRPRLKDKNI